MQQSLLVIEQMDRAARELATDHPINSRLALILVDNALELVIHRRCKERALLDMHLHKQAWSDAKLSQTQCRDALGRRLNKKLDVLHALDLITTEERRFINICHENYRNELYHVGIMHEGLIRAIAGQYYKLTCDLIGRLQPSTLDWSSDNRTTEIGARYVGHSNGLLSPFNELKELPGKLMAELPNIEPLPAALSTTVHGAIDDVEEAFKFLLNGAPGTETPDKLLYDLQFYRERSLRLEKSPLTTHPKNRSEEQEILNALKALMANWKPKYRKANWPGWRLRASGVELKANPLLAMDAYTKLRNDMEYLEGVILEGAAALDQHIQMQIDAAREDDAMTD